MMPLIVSTFPNAKALPLWLGVARGIFAAAGVDVSLHETGSSKEQREQLAAGGVHIVQAAVDNALAMIKSGSDVIIFMGGEGGMNDFIVATDIASFEDLRGRTLAVDSTDTAYALLARKVLAGRGLELGRDYELRAVGNGSKRVRALKADASLAGAVLNPPFSAEALLAGMRSLGSLDDLVGAYQAGGAFALREWALMHPDAVDAYIRGYLASLDWLCDRANRDEAINMLRERLALDGEVARATYDQLCDPVRGFTPQAKFNHAGFDLVLSVRADTEGYDAVLADPRAYVDLSFYERAAAKEKR